MMTFRTVIWAAVSTPEQAKDEKEATSSAAG